MTTDPQTIDRMVDGELSAEEQQRVLVQCEESGRWRELALAYVESQVFNDELKQFVERSSTVQPAGDPVRGQRAMSWNAISLAAALLVSLSLGYGLGWWLPSDRLPPAILANGDRRENSPDSDIATAAALPKSIPFMAANPRTHEVEQFEIPVISQKELGSNWAEHLHAELPEDLLSEMRRAGVKLVGTRTLMPVRTPEGRRVVVPIDYFIEAPYQ